MGVSSPPSLRRNHGLERIVCTLCGILYLRTVGRPRLVTNSIILNVLKYSGHTLHVRVAVKKCLELRLAFKLNTRFPP